MSRGIYWMLLATLLFVSLDAVAKYLTQHYPVVQVVWARFAFHMLFVLALLGRQAATLVGSRRLGLQLTRSVLMLGANVFFFLALRTMPLVDATSISFVGPLIVTALSVPLLGERVGPRRWAAVVVGFAGAMIIIRPGPGVLQSAAMLPLLSALSFSLYQITTRLLGHVDNPLTTLLYSAVVGAIASTAALPLHWQGPDALGWGLMVATGVLGALGQLALIRAVLAAPLSVIVPFNYATLVWSALLGFAVFGDSPDTGTLVGAAVIVASGLYLFHRERVQAGGAEAAQQTLPAQVAVTEAVGDAPATTPATRVEPAAGDDEPRPPRRGPP